MPQEFGEDFKKEHEKAEVVLAELIRIFSILRSPVNRKSIADLLRNEAERIENQINEERKSGT